MGGCILLMGRLRLMSEEEGRIAFVGRDQDAECIRLCTYDWTRELENYRNISWD